MALDEASKLTTMKIMMMILILMRASIKYRLALIKSYYLVYSIKPLS
jgi:hypothetical protein